MHFAPATVTRPRPFGRRRDRGFSLLIVFMLIIVMVGAAATVILSTQQDLSVAGQDREALQAFYAAEYAVASAKDQLTFFNASYWSSATGWTPLLSSGIAELCAPSSSPTTTPGTSPSTNDGWKEFMGGKAWVNSESGGSTGSGPRVQYRWCVHNDPEDIAYADPSVLVKGETADTSDAHDTGRNYIVIEGYGRVTDNAAATDLAIGHVWVTVGAPSGTLSVPANCYSQEGGCGAHQGNGGTAEQNVGVIAPTGQPTSVKGL